MINLAFDRKRGAMEISAMNGADGAVREFPNKYFARGKNPTFDIFNWKW